MAYRVPEVGYSTVKELRVAICRKCGCVIETNMCSYDCPEDGDPHTDVAIHVWKRTDTFERVEMCIKLARAITELEKTT